MSPTSHRKTRLLCALLLTLFVCCLHPSETRAAVGNELQNMLNTRVVNCWVEGTFLDELVLNARGKLTFLYVDSKLGNELLNLRSAASDGAFSDMLSLTYLDYATAYAKRKGHALLTIRVEASKPWDFDTSKLRVGPYRPLSSDLATDTTGVPGAEILPGVSELPSGFMGYINLYVPREHLKPGSEIEIGYDEYLTKWKIPK